MPHLPHLQAATLKCIFWLYYKWNTHEYSSRNRRLFVVHSWVFGFTLQQACMNSSGIPVSSQAFIKKTKQKKPTHRHPGAGSDSGNKIPLPTGSLPLDLLEAVEGSREVVEQALSLDLSLPLERGKKKEKWLMLLIDVQILILWLYLFQLLRPVNWNVSEKLNKVRSCEAP